MTVLVFLHVPKTAGQTIHSELSRITDEAAISPVRLHHQAPQDEKMEPGYQLYSGHIDWVGLDDLPEDRFAFTVLRDPRERIASFYFFLRRQASELSEQDLADPKRLGMRRALKWSADDYFIGGDDDWQEFVRDHYDNFYCSYFASRLVRGRKEIATLPREAQILRALKGLQDLDAVYGTTTLRRLERDILSVTGQRIRVVGRLSNAAKGSKPRWPQLVSALQTPEARARVEEFVATDLELLDRFHRTEARGKPRNWLQLFKRSR